MNIFRALIIIFLLVQPCKAGFHGGGSPANGQLVINVGNASNGGYGFDYIFANALKLWEPSVTDPSAIDDNGYPASGTLAANLSGQITNVSPSQTTGATTWVIAWNGKNGTPTVPGFQITTAVTVVSDPGGCVKQPSNFQVGGTNCYIEFTWNSTQTAPTALFLSGAVFDGTLANMFIGRKSDYQAGNTFLPEFITTLRSLRPKIIRFIQTEGLNSNANPNIAANYSDLTPASYVSYARARFSKAVWAGKDVTNTNAYALSFGSAVAYTEGLTITVGFQNASTGSVTFNLNGIGAVPVLDMLGNQLGSGGVTANAVRTLVYRSLLGGFVSRVTGIGSGIPTSVAVQLCNTVGADLWYNIPFQATTSFATSLANEVKGTLNGTAYYEYSNEVWNFAAYGITTQARKLGIALGFPSPTNGEDYHGWYALQTRVLMGAITTAYGANNKFKRVLAFQAYGDPTATNTYRIAGHDLNGTSFPAYAAAGYPNYDTAPNRPVDYADVLSYATYFAGAQTMTLGPSSDADYLSVQSAVTINGATSANPTVFQTSAAHGYTTGQRVYLGVNSASGRGTNFTGPWAAFNQTSQTITVTDATHFSVPVDSSAFAAYSSNGGSSERYANEMTGLTAAADNFALGTAPGIAAALSWLDGDIRAGTNYGVLGSQTLASYNSASGGGNGIFPGWESVNTANGYNKQIIAYEGGFQGAPPVNASTCTALGISTSYCGLNGLIGNMIGMPTTVSASSYKYSSLYQATVTLQWQNMFAQPHTVYGAWLAIAGDDQWSLYPGDIFSSPVFSSFNAYSNFHYP